MNWNRGDKMTQSLAQSFHLPDMARRVAIETVSAIVRFETAQKAVKILSNTSSEAFPATTELSMSLSRW